MGIQSVSSTSSNAAQQLGLARTAIGGDQRGAKVVKADLLSAKETTSESLSRDELRDTAERVGKAVSVLNQALTYEIDDTTDTIITKIVNRYTRELIRQIPPEDVVEISRRFHEYVGLIFNNET